MALAFVNRDQNTPAFSAASSASTAGISHSAGNLLVVYCFFTNGSGASSITLGDTAGNSYTAIGSPFTGITGNTMQLHYKANCLGNASNVVTATVDAGTSGVFALSVRQFSGAATTSVLEASPASANGTGTAASSGSVTVTATDAIIVAGLFADNDGITAGSGYSADSFDISPTAGSLFADEYHIVTASESATATVTFSNWGVVAAAFKIATGPPPPPPPPSGGIFQCSIIG